MVAEVWLIGKTCHLSATLAVQDPEGETTSLDSKSYSGCHHWSSHRLHPYSSEGLGRTSTNWEACRCSWSWCCFKAVLMFQGMCCVPSNPAIDTLILLHFKIEDLMILPPQLRPRPQVSEATRLGSIYVNIIINIHGLPRLMASRYIRSAGKARI